MQASRIPSLLVCSIITLEGCARAASPVSAPTPGAIPELPARYDICAIAPQQCDGDAQRFALRDLSKSSGSEIILNGALAGAPAVSRRSSSPLRALEKAALRAVSPGVTRAPGAPAAEPTAGAGERRPLVDLEAHLSLEVPDSRAAGRAVRALTLSAGGDVVNEAFEDSSSAMGWALSLRVPSERAEWLIARLTELGKVRSLKTEASDLSRKVADAETVLGNLEAALTRYQALLARADSAHEMVEIEKELERVRLGIERVKTDLAWMQDRVARSTVYVQLTLPVAERVDKKAQLYPGARLPWLVDLEPGGASSGYFGGGVSALIARSFNLDLDLLTHTQASERDGVDLLLFTAGVELYSDLLGAGRRRVLNPYLGFRAGYANLASDSALLLGASLGLEILRTEFVILEVQTRAYALVNGAHGTHVLLQPALALNFAY